MNRTITYPGALPKSADFLNAQRNAMIAAGGILQAVFGTSAVASGFACTALSVPGMGVQVSAGALTLYTTVDATAYGELAADLTKSIVKQGINLAPTTLSMAAPTTAGQSIAYLVEGTFAEVDGTPVVLPYVNAANPSQPYAGPTNSGATQNTTRDQTVTLAVKAGAAAATGSQTAPAADSGCVPLFVVTVAYGQTAITASSIAQHPSAPLIDAQNTGRGIQPGRLLNVQVFTTSGGYTPTIGANKIRVTAVGGGGGSGGSYATTGTTVSIGAGGNSGSWGAGIYAVTGSVTVTIGAGGAAGSAGSGGGTGGTSSFGSLLSAPGGHGSIASGAVAPPYTVGPGNASNIATGGTIVNGREATGGLAVIATTTSYISGGGGNGPFGGGGASAGPAGGGSNGMLGGGGGGIATGVSASTGTAGFSGGNGIVIIEEFS